MNQFYGLKGDKPPSSPFYLPAVPAYDAGSTMTDNGENHACLAL
ncbi:MAG: hypothetical protein ACREXN_01100 [Polaromonas sp.]